MPVGFRRPPSRHETFQATVPPDSETLQAIACYIDRLGYQKIAILTEGNTAYGQNFSQSKRSAEERQTAETAWAARMGKALRRS